MTPGELDEMVEKPLRELLPARGCAYRNCVHVSNRLGLRDESEQISHDLWSAANDERRVSELVNEKRVMQMTGIAAVPEFIQFIQNLVVVRRGAVG